MVLVTGGYKSSALASVELLNLDGSFLCKLPSLPDGRSGHTQTGLVACGGWPRSTNTNSKDCLTFSIGMEEWKISHNLTEERIQHSSWDSPEGVVLLGGWKNENTTEILTNSGDSIPGFKLKYEIE